MKRVFEIVLRNERDEDDYIIIGSYKSLEQAQYMLEWYEGHHRFFKGEFSIRFS